MEEKTKFHITVWAIAGILTVAAFLIVLFVKQDYSVLGWCNVTFLSGAIVLLLFLLYVVVHFGALDIFTYGFSDLFYHMNPKQDKVRKYRDYADFMEKQKQKRQALPVYWLPFLVLCGALLVAAAILRIIYQVSLDQAEIASSIEESISSAFIYRLKTLS